MQDFGKFLFLPACVLACGLVEGIIELFVTRIPSNRSADLARLGGAPMNLRFCSREKILLSSKLLKLEMRPEGGMLDPFKVIPLGLLPGQLPFAPPFKAQSSEWRFELWFSGCPLFLLRKNPFFRSRP